MKGNGVPILESALPSTGFCCNCDAANSKQAELSSGKLLAASSPSVEQKARNEGAVLSSKSFFDDTWINEREVRSRRRIEPIVRRETKMAPMPVDEEPIVLLVVERRYRSTNRLFWSNAS